MFTVRRWWDRYGPKFFVTGLVLAVALFLRQTQGAFVSELYYQVVQSFQPGPTPQERWADARVSELETKLVDLEQQNQKLQELLDYTETYQGELIAAPVIGRSVDHWWKQVTLGCGSTSGIKTGYVVSSPGGLVGRVIKVTPNTSRVLLASDPTSKVGGKIARNNFMGYIRGEGSGTAVMEFFDKVPDVKPGDKIVTSPVSYLFPAGIPIGTVETVDLEKSPAPEVVVKFTAPFDYLEWVVVHPFESRL